MVYPKTGRAYSLSCLFVPVLTVGVQKLSPLGELYCHSKTSQEPCARVAPQLMHSVHPGIVHMRAQCKAQYSGLASTTKLNKRCERAYSVKRQGHNHEEQGFTFGSLPGTAGHGSILILWDTSQGMSSCCGCSP